MRAPTGLVISGAEDKLLRDYSVEHGLVYEPSKLYGPHSSHRAEFLIRVKETQLWAVAFLAEWRFAELMRKDAENLY